MSKDFMVIDEFHNACIGIDWANDKDRTVYYEPNKRGDIMGKEIKVSEAKSEINIDEAITRAAKETANEIIKELKAKKYIKNDISYFRKVEILLYQYKNLKIAISQKEEDIKYIEEHGLPEKSKSIVMYQTGGGNISSEERYVQLIEKYKMEMIETEREVKRIDNALKQIKKDKYYKIIELKYMDKDRDDMTDEEISELLDKDQSTISRNRKRLINMIKTILFPESIKELA